MLFVAVLLLVFSPTIFALGWHLIHGNTIEFDGHRVAVPMGWTAEAEGRLSLSITKYSATVVPSPRFRASVSISPMPPDPKGSSPKDDTLWEKAFWTFAFPGQRVEGPVRMGSGSDEVVCMKAIDTRRIGWQSARCVMLNDTWDANFDGDADDMNTFLDIVRTFN